MPTKFVVFLFIIFLFSTVYGHVSACSNQCLNDGDKQCASASGYSGYETCSDYNYDGCLEWSGIIVCQAGAACNNGSCVAGAAQTCVPAAVSVCKVCNAAGTAWVDDSSKCATGKICQNDLCVNSACAAATCASLAHNCGSWPDGCGGTLSCGTCASGSVCNNGTCAAPASAAPTVDLKVNGIDGPVSVTEGGSIVISWTSTNSASCAAFGSWSGNQPSSGLLSAGVVAGTNTYSIVCSGSGGIANDSVIVNAASSAPVISLPSRLQIASGASAPLQATVENNSGSMSYSWFCSSGTLSSMTDLAPVYVAPVVSRQIDANCALSARDTHNHYLQKSIQITITPQGSTQTNNPIQGNNQSNNSTTNSSVTISAAKRAEILAQIARIQALIANLQKQLAAINSPNVATTGNGVLTVLMQVGNITQALPFAKTANAHAGDVLTFKIAVSNSVGGTFSKVILNNVLPGLLNAPQNIKINGVVTAGTFSQGLDIGGFNAGQSKTVTFTAAVSHAASYQSFNDTATAAAGGVSAYDTVNIIVN